MSGLFSEEIELSTGSCADCFLLVGAVTLGEGSGWEIIGLSF